MLDVLRLPPVRNQWIDRSDDSSLAPLPPGPPQPHQVDLYLHAEDALRRRRELRCDPLVGAAIERWWQVRDPRLSYCKYSQLD